LKGMSAPAAAIPGRVARQQSPLPLHRLPAILKSQGQVCQPRTRANKNPLDTAGWRMASTAMRLVIIAACAGAFYVLIGGFHSKLPLPLSFFETQGCARPAPAGRTSAM